VVKTAALIPDTALDTVREETRTQDLARFTAKSVDDVKKAYALLGMLLHCMARCWRLQIQSSKFVVESNSTMSVPRCMLQVPASLRTDFVERIETVAKAHSFWKPPTPQTSYAQTCLLPPDPRGVPPLVVWIFRHGISPYM
jgi:hypothetical protein